jgi:RimJ/RimL family protein N-acetyltransferase
MIHLANTPVLHTPRLTLRAPGPQDWEAFAGFSTSGRASMVGGPLTRDKAWRAFAHLIGHWPMRGFGMFIITVTGDDTAIGMTGPWRPEGWPEPEIGWSMFTAASEGKGLAHEAAQAAVAHAFRDLGWSTVVSYIDPANARSIALALRLGAVLDAGAPIPDTDPCLVYRHPAQVAA